MSPLALVIINLLLALVVITVIHFSFRTYLLRSKDNPDTEDNRRKLTVFSLVLAIVVIAVIQIALWALLRGKPATVETLMEELKIPAVIPEDDLKLPEVVTTDSLYDSMRDELLTRFIIEYSVEPTPDEAAHLMDLLKKNRFSFDQTEYIREVIRIESMRQRIGEKNLIRHALSETDPSDREKRRIFWSKAAWDMLVRSEEYKNKLEPVYAEFTAWWKQQHQEYEEMVAENKSMGTHEELMESFTKSIRNDTVSDMAHKLEDKLETSLRVSRGTALSDEKRRKTLALFRRYSGELFTKEMMRKIADAIVEETGLSDDEIFHCLLLKDRPLPDGTLAKIMDVRDRFLNPDPFNDISPETANRIKMELQKIIDPGSDRKNDAKNAESAASGDAQNAESAANGDAAKSGTGTEAAVPDAPVMNAGEQ